ncbi:DUF4389 domain-containing protein [Paeniglutamicibacter sulfureus]|uniref:DUF4389 domain-containing protein n=1 Tax=Paeniglutamicibacter sulfureus TaxID=43666 RepID=A0ABU2BCL7_9MICC|nr:DUF4389 domain-containing protein [Paeniglutamicibacter sulfureus]MDR7356340.1 hypothetical protein [Paeniglutamicibacter sulfureus]
MTNPPAPPLQTPPVGHMPGIHLALLLFGALLIPASLGALAIKEFRDLDLSALLIAAGIALGIVAILVGAAGLGRGIGIGAPQASALPGPVPATPVHLSGHLDPGLSRWMWLVKWILAIPHVVVLALLWVAFLVVTVAAGLVILVTGRYPASWFQFSVGVLRWQWRVSFYAYGVLGTDSYPPFTLARGPYPAQFDVFYPARLSRWKVLVKSWLLALPHLLVIAALSGGSWDTEEAGISLLGLLVLIAGVVLLVTGTYRRGLFDLLLGLNRWIQRTVAYTSLLTDAYPPFRLDQGPGEPAAYPGEPGPSGADTRSL